MPPTNKDYYKILQVDPSADPEIIVVAYKRLARIYHPDINKARMLRSTCKKSTQLIRYSMILSHVHSTISIDLPVPQSLMRGMQRNDPSGRKPRLRGGVLKRNDINGKKPRLPGVRLRGQWCMNSRACASRLTSLSR